MVIVILALILAGSVSGAVVLWVQDASFWGIALGYVAGGWAGLLGGMAAMMAVRGLAGIFARLPRASKRPDHHQQKTLP